MENSRINKKSLNLLKKKKVSLAEAAKVAKISIEELLTVLSKTQIDKIESRGRAAPHIFHHRTRCSKAFHLDAGW